MFLNYRPSWQRVLVENSVFELLLKYTVLDEYSLPAWIYVARAAEYYYYTTTLVKEFSN